MCIYHRCYIYGLLHHLWTKFEDHKSLLIKDTMVGEKLCEKNYACMPRLQAILSMLLLGGNLIDIRLLNSQTKVWKEQDLPYVS